MPLRVRGVVSHKKDEPFSVKTIVISDPGAREAVVQVQAPGAAINSCCRGRDTSTSGSAKGRILC